MYKNHRLLYPFWMILKVSTDFQKEVNGYASIVPHDLYNIDYH